MVCIRRGMTMNFLLHVDNNGKPLTVIMGLKFINETGILQDTQEYRA